MGLAVTDIDQDMGFNSQLMLRKQRKLSVSFI